MQAKVNAPIAKRIDKAGREEPPSASSTRIDPFCRLCTKPEANTPLLISIAASQIGCAVIREAAKEMSAMTVAIEMSEGN